MLYLVLSGTERCSTAEYFVLLEEFRKDYKLLTINWLYEETVEHQTLDCVSGARRRVLDAALMLKHEADK